VAGENVGTNGYYAGVAVDVTNSNSLETMPFFPSWGLFEYDNMLFNCNIKDGFQGIQIFSGVELDNLGDYKKLTLEGFYPNSIFIPSTGEVLFSDFNTTWGVVGRISKSGILQDVIGTGGADSYVSNVALSSNDLTFTGVGSAFNSTVGNVANIGISNTFTGELNLFSSTGGEVYAKSTSAASTGAGFMVTNEASANRFQFGYNNNSNEAFIMATQDEPIKILTNSSEQYRFDGETFWIKDVGATPTTPNSTFGGFYTKGDLPYFISDGGTEYDLSSSGSGLWESVTDGIAPTDTTYVVFVGGDASIGTGSIRTYSPTNTALRGKGFYRGLYGETEATSGNASAGVLGSSLATGTAETYGGTFLATSGTGGVGVNAAGSNLDLLLSNSGIMETKETASSTTPRSGYGNWYFKTDGKPYAKNDGGTEYDLSSGGGSGGGDVYKSGTPVNNQMAIWTNDSTIEGDADITFDGTDLTVNGDIVGDRVYNQVASSQSTSGTISFDTRSNSDSDVITLTGNSTLNINYIDAVGQKGEILIRQDATGSRTLAIAGWTGSGSGALTEIYSGGLSLINPDANSYTKIIYKRFGTIVTIDVVYYE
jgi:hypothetical protein